jgi:hypothetical protein
MIQASIYEPRKEEQIKCKYKKENNKNQWKTYQK